MSSLVMCKLEKRPQVARCHLSTPEMRAYLSDAKKQVPYCDSAFLTQTKIKAEQGREHLPKKEESLTFFSCTVTTQLRQGFSECSYFVLGISVISDTNLIISFIGSTNLYQLLYHEILLLQNLMTEGFKTFYFQPLTMKAVRFYYSKNRHLEFQNQD